MAALAAGTDNRPVTTKEIQAHLDDFALAKEFSVYGKIGGLSGGQKVKGPERETFFFLAFFFWDGLVAPTW